MKKIIFLLFVLFLFPSDRTYAQLNWMQLSSGTYENLKDVYFFNVNTGWAVGNAGKVIKTTNAGQTWISYNFPMSTVNNCVFFINENTGFVGNSDGNVYKSINGGINWIAYGTGAPNEVTSVYFTSEYTGYLGNSAGHIKYSSNGGVNWATITMVPGRVNKITFIDNFRGWISENYGYIYRTTNAGASFNYTRPTTNPVNGIQFISSTIGYASSDSGNVYKSTNGGVNWNKINTGINAKLNKIAVIHPDIAVAAGNNGNILMTTNGGADWNIKTPTANNLNSIYFIPGTLYGYCVGDVGTVLRSFTSVVSGGCIGNGTAQLGYPFDTYYMDSRTDLLYLSSEVASVTGTGAGYIKSIGFYFVSTSSQPMNGFKIKMKNTSLSTISDFESSGWMLAYDSVYTVPGTGLRTINLQTPFFWNGSNLLIEMCFNNSGITANSIVYGTNVTNMSVHNHANLVTGDGCTNVTTGVLQTNRPNLCLYTVTISNSETTLSNVPDKFMLYQNYPNPFNPVTKIRYDVSKKNFISLKIFDATGRLIETLVDENKETGSYLVDFNAANLASGIYFYKLEAGDFAETKKMVLIK